MKKHNTNCRKRIPVMLLAFAALATAVKAQNDFTPSSNDLYIDRLVNPGTPESLSLRDTAGYQAKYASPAAPFSLWGFTGFTFTPSYGFNATVSKTGDGGQTNTNSVTSDLSMIFHQVLLLDTAVAWKNSFGDNTKGNLTNANSIGINITPSFSVLEFLHKEYADDVVLAGLTFGYQHTDQSLRNNKGYSITPSNSYSISPNIVWQRFLYQTADYKLSIASNPAFSELWKDSGGAKPMDVDGGTFSMQERLDFLILKQGPFNGLTLTSGAMWSHAIDQQTVSATNAHFQDWADFTAAVRYCPQDEKGDFKTAVKISYDYTAFRPDTYSNSVNLSVSVPF